MDRQELPGMAGPSNKGLKRPGQSAASAMNEALRQRLGTCEARVATGCLRAGVALSYFFFSASVRLKAPRDIAI
jgi:hypothetical protein